MPKSTILFFFWSFSTFIIYGQSTEVNYYTLSGTSGIPSKFQMAFVLGESQVQMSFDKTTVRKDGVLPLTIPPIDKIISTKTFTRQALSACKFTTYPNPTINYLSIHPIPDKKDPWTISVIAVDGSVMFRKMYTTEYNRLDIGHLAAGYYQLLIKQSNRTCTTSFIKK